MLASLEYEDSIGICNQIQLHNLENSIDPQDEEKEQYLAKLQATKSTLSDGDLGSIFSAQTEEELLLVEIEEAEEQTAFEGSESAALSISTKTQSLANSLTSQRSNSFSTPTLSSSSGTPSPLATSFSASSSLSSPSFAQDMLSQSLPSEFNMLELVQSQLLRQSSSSDYNAQFAHRSYSDGEASSNVSPGTTLAKAQCWKKFTVLFPQVDHSRKTYVTMLLDVNNTVEENIKLAASHVSVLLDILIDKVYRIIYINRTNFYIRRRGLKKWRNMDFSARRMIFYKVSTLNLWKS